MNGSGKTHRPDAARTGSDTVTANRHKLLLVKSIHTLVWIFFNVVIFYLLYAVIVNKIGQWVWIGLGLFVLEGIVLLLFKMMCPLTVIARRYSGSTKDNFDIFLPNWLARYNKTIYTSLLGIIIVILIFQLVSRN